ncbi:MAG: hypothetical protein Kow0069_36290 [Promethearchaeota archaeon]
MLKFPEPPPLPADPQPVPCTWPWGEYNTAALDLGFNWWEERDVPEVRAALEDLSAAFGVPLALVDPGGGTALARGPGGEAFLAFIGKVYVGFAALEAAGSLRGALLYENWKPEFERGKFPVEAMAWRLDLGWVEESLAGRSRSTRTRWRTAGPRGRWAARATSCSTSTSPRSS